MHTREITVISGEIFIVDDEDYERVSKFVWYLAGAGYARTPKGIEWWDMHRYIMDIYPGDRRYVDHKDRILSHNYKSNLRVCSSKQSAGNRRKRFNSNSQYKGVNKLPNGLFQARIVGEYLGRYYTEEQAAKAYDVAALQKWGEFALLNF